MMILFFLSCDVKEYEQGVSFFDSYVDHNDETFLFDPFHINEISMTIGEESVKILRSERRFSYPRNKVRADIKIDGEIINDIGIRMRGGLGSFTRFDVKPKWEVDFNAFEEQHFHGLHSISLNNMTDCSSLTEPLGFLAHQLVGNPTSRVGYAQIYVNGLNYGLYSIVDTQDEVW